MPTETLTVLGLLIAFGVVHSLTAALVFKALMITLMGQRAYLGLYRLVYNGISVVTFGGIWLYVMLNPGGFIWQVDAPASYAFFIVQGIGVVGLVISMLQIDFMRFAGLSQMVAWLAGKPLPLPAEPFVTNGVYGLVRHPLYLFSLLFLWATPAMSAGWLGLCIGATLYFALGSLWEERKLMRQFGETYRLYRATVPWMIPFVGPFGNAATQSSAPTSESGA